MEFYDVKIRAKVQVPDGKVKKIKITQKNGQVRFAFRGYTEDNRKLTKFCSQSDWDSSSYAEE